MSKEILLTQGVVAIVDDNDYEEINKRLWYAIKKKNTFYAVTKRRKNDGTIETVFMHRLILGVYDPSVVVDHIDRNGLNNTRNNLRLCRNVENILNRTPHGRSKFIGVSWHKKTGKWRARIRINNKEHSLGYFDNEEAAAIAYNIEAEKQFKEFANLNKI